MPDILKTLCLKMAGTRPEPLPAHCCALFAIVQNELLLDIHRCKSYADPGFETAAFNRVELKTSSLNIHRKMP